MYVWSDITAVHDYEMHYMNAWLNRCVFNLHLNRECVWTPNITRKAIPEFLVDFAIRGTTKSPEFCDLGSGLDCSVIED